MEFYRQTSQYTGAAAALLMAMHAKKPDQYALDREQEFSIWTQSANLPTRSSSIYALALIARQAGIATHVVVGEKEYDYPDYRFKRYKKIEIDEAKYTSKLYAKRAREEGIPLEEREFTLTEVKQHLDNGAMVLLRVNAGIFRERKATSKYVLVRAHEEGEYVIMDPDQGEMRIPDEEMQEAFDTLVTKKKRDHRMVILK